MKPSVSKYVILASILIVAWLFTAFIPTYRSHQKTHQEIAETEKQLRDFENTLSRLPDFIEGYNELQSTKRNLNARLYTKNDVLKLFERIYLEATENDLTITEITPPIEELLSLNRQVGDPTKPLFLNISIRIKGGYRNFAGFIRSIEHSDFYRGTNICQIVGETDEVHQLDQLYGFRALLGSLEGVS